MREINFKIKELKKNLNPFYVYNIFKDELNSVFLDSSKEDKNLSKFSFIGINPFCNFTYKNGKGYINGEEIQEKQIKIGENGVYNIEVII